LSKDVSVQEPMQMAKDCIKRMEYLNLYEQTEVLTTQAINETMSLEEKAALIENIIQQRKNL